MGLFLSRGALRITLPLALILWVHVDLSVTVDAAQKQQQAARVILYDSSQNPVKVLSVDPTPLLPGGATPGTFTVHWDGTTGGDMGGVAPPMPIEPAPKGVYLFKWECAGDSDKSPFLTVTTAPGEALTLSADAAHTTSCCTTTRFSTHRGRTGKEVGDEVAMRGMRSSCLFGG